ncbi:MAG TPA: DUF2493 domain-containing protein [Xanthobacteraceae bacterium]|nr:DUF2493 domain-containing protein [Xanthobacteraceae bacterium]
MKVLVCGGRDFADADTLDAWLDHIHETRGPITMIIEGDARGADRLARKYAKRRRIPCVTFKPDWASYNDAAGPIRNRQMLIEGRPDLVVAFPGGAGTANMIKQATGVVNVIIASKANIPHRER